MSESELDLSSSYYTQNSTPSEAPSPVTPTFSSRGHLRYPSSASSIESPVQTTGMDCPASPTFTASRSKRSLPDVQEEPQEKESDIEMFDEDMDDLYDCLCKHGDCLQLNLAHVEANISTL